MNEQDDKFTGSLKTLFDNSVENLDDRTAREIVYLRDQSMQADTGKPSRLLIPAGALATVVVAAVIYFLPANHQPSLPPSIPVDDFEMLSSTENFELYENLEFYQWLDENDLSS